MIAALLMLLAAGAAGAAPLRVQPVEIVDRQGFERPLRAYTMLLPAGWRHESQVAWQPTAGGCQRPYHPRLQAQPADGSQQIALLPGEVWGRGSFGALAPGCPVATLDRAEAYLRAWVQRHRPGARWLGFEPRPDLVQAPVTTDLGGGAAMRRWRDAGRARIAYVHEGRPVQEILATGVQFSASTMPGLPGQPPLQTFAGEALGVLAWRAGGDGPEARAFDALWGTLRSDPAWSARIQQGMAQMAQDNAATQARISQIHAETGRQALAETARRGQILASNRAEIAAMQQQGYEQRMQSQDRQQTRTVRAIRGVEPWRDSGGQLVELPHGYPHAWKLKDGSYLLTDDANLRPGRDLGVEGEALKPVR